MTHKTSAKLVDGSVPYKSGGRSKAAAAGQALFEMANLRPERTGLPFVVFISQRGGARHDVRVKIATGPRVRPDEMISIAIRPTVRAVRGGVDPADLDLLRQWVELNRARACPEHPRVQGEHLPVEPLAWMAGTSPAMTTKGDPR